MSFLASASAILFGLFAAGAPDRASKLWGRRDLDQMAPRQLATYFRWYRAFGIILTIGGVLLSVDRLYH